VTLKVGDPCRVRCRLCGGKDKPGFAVEDGEGACYEFCSYHVLLFLKVVLTPVMASMIDG
jgi:hypothetical protein